MTVASLPVLNDEHGRIAALKRLEILDTAPEDPFEHIVSLVRSVLNVPMVAVSLVDLDRQWFKAHRGLTVSETPRTVSFCAYAIDQVGPLIVQDAKLDPRFMFNALVEGDPGIRSYAGVQLRTPDGYQVGTLCVIDNVPREFSSTEIAMLSNFAKIVERELELRQIAECDFLTGALTRRAFHEKADTEIARFARYGRPSCIVLADLDHFKAVNDTHGHPAGDAVLCAAARLVKENLRPNDLLGRLGGEEFAVILPETDARAALRAAERFRLLLAESEIALPCGAHIRVTASFGIAEISPAIATTKQWLAAADTALYLAKSAGRNRCQFAA